MKEVIYRPEAAADVEEACAWYERQWVGLGAEFLASLQAAEEAVRAVPLAYQLHRRDTRRYRLRRFPYQLFYRVLAERIVIVACFQCPAVASSPQNTALTANSRLQRAAVVRSEPHPEPTATLRSPFPADSPSVQPRSSG